MTYSRVNFMYEKRTGITQITLQARCGVYERYMYVRINV